MVNARGEGGSRVHKNLAMGVAFNVHPRCGGASLLSDKLRQYGPLAHVACDLTGWLDCFCIYLFSKQVVTVDPFHPNVVSPSRMRDVGMWGWVTMQWMTLPSIMIAQWTRRSGGALVVMCCCWMFDSSDI